MSWCGFSVPAIANARLFIFSLSLAFSILISTFAGSDEGIDLPEYSLELVSDKPEFLKVGDVLRFKIIPPPPVAENTQEISASPLVRLPEELTQKGLEIDPMLAAGWMILGSKEAFVKEGRDFVIHLVPVTGGNTVVPSFSISEGASPLGFTRPYEISVRSVAQEAPKDPENPFLPPVAISYPTWVRILIISGLLLLLTAIAWFVYRKYIQAKMRKSQAIVFRRPLSPPRPAHIVALELLNNLNVRELKTREEYKAFYFRVSEILKEYLGDRYDFHAPESTTEELIRVMKEKQLSTEVRVAVERIFHEMDTVKFTDLTPVSEAAPKVLESAKGLVHQTESKTESSVVGTRGSV